MTNTDICNGAKCCCSCNWLLNIMRHPGNPDGIGRGSISEQYAYACLALELDDPQPGKRSRAIFSFHEHGMCEMYERLK